MLGAGAAVAAGAPGAPAGFVCGCLVTSEPGFDLICSRPQITGRQRTAFCRDDRKTPTPGGGKVRSFRGRTLTLLQMGLPWEALAQQHSRSSFPGL